MQTKSIVSLLFLLTLGVSVSSQAQDGMGTLSESWAMTVKRGHEAQFEAAFKAHAKVRQDAGDPRHWDTFQPVTGADMSVYYLRTCCFTWADQDAYTEWEKNNPKVMGDWFANVDQHVESYAHYFDQMDPENSHWSDPPPVMNYVGVMDYTIEAGEAADFHTARRELSQIAINQGWGDSHNWGWSESIGGSPSASLAVPFANFAAMAGAGQNFREFIIEHMGAEGAEELMERFGDSVEKSHYSIWVRRADLSYGSD